MIPLQVYLKIGGEYILHGYQITLLTEKMYELHELIRTSNWDKLIKEVELGCTIDSIIYELDEYPGKITQCSINEFFNAMRFDGFDGFTIDVIGQFWIDGEESDLSMECKFDFYGKELKKIKLETVHVL